MSFPISDTATITMSIHDFRHIERFVDELRAQINTLRARETPVRDADETTADLIAALDAALPIVQFAVGNLNPESVRGWPYDAVQQLSALIAHLFPENSDRQSLAVTLQQFAKEAVEVEALRIERLRVAHEVLSTSAEADDA